MGCRRRAGGRQGGAAEQLRDGPRLIVTDAVHTPPYVPFLVCRNKMGAMMFAGRGLRV